LIIGKDNPGESRGFLLLWRVRDKRGELRPGGREEWRASARLTIQVAGFKATVVLGTQHNEIILA